MHNLHGCTQTQASFPGVTDHLKTITTQIITVNTVILDPILHPARDIDLIFQGRDGNCPGSGFREVK